MQGPRGGSEPERDPEGRERIELLSAVQLEGARVVEIGCGDGRLTWKFAGRTQGVLAVDPDGPGLRSALAQLRGMGSDLEVDFVQAEGGALPARRESFDLALFSWSL